MISKHLLKLFLYSNRNRNGFFNVSVSSLLKTQNGILPFVRSVTTVSSKAVATNDIPEKDTSSKTYFKQYLLNNNYCSSYFNIENIDSVEESDFKSIKLLADLTNKGILSDENVKLAFELSDCFEKEISNFEVEDIRKALILIHKYKSFSSENHNIKRMEACIDKELCKRNLSHDEILKILCTFSAIQTRNFLSNFYFPIKASFKLMERINRMNPQQIALFFFCAPNKNLGKHDFKFSVLSHLSENMTKFNCDELGIIANGLLKLNFTFNNPNIYRSFITKMKVEIDNIHSVPFRNVCLTLQKFLKYQNVEDCLEFQKELIPYISNLNELSVLAAALMGVKYRAIDSSYKEFAVEKLKNYCLNFEMPYIVRLMVLTVYFNIQDKDILMSLLTELEKRSKCQNHRSDHFTEMLVVLLPYFCEHRLYSESLLNDVFSSEFLDRLDSRNFPVNKKMSWWSLYCHVNLEKPDYCKIDVNPSLMKSTYALREYLFKVKGSPYNTGFNSSVYIRKILTHMYGESKVFMTNILPHYDSGIVMGFNDKFEAQHIPQKFDRTHFFAKKSLNDGNIWVFIMPLNISDYLWESNELILPKQTQARELKLVGFIPVLVNYAKFSELTEDCQENFLRSLLQKALQNSSQQMSMSNSNIQ